MREAESWLGQTPKTKLQTPKKLQTPNPQADLRLWIRTLELGIFLVFGVWFLVFHFFSSFIAMITAPMSAAVSSRPMTSSGNTNFVISASPICLTVASAIGAGSR